MQKNWIGKSVGCEIDFVTNNEKKIKLYYDYITPDSFFGDVEYVIEQREGNDFKYNITGIYETCDEDDEDCIWIHYEKVK